MGGKTGDITRATLVGNVLNVVSVQQNAAESTYRVYEGVHIDVNGYLASFERNDRWESNLGPMFYHKATKSFRIDQADFLNRVFVLQ